MKKIRFLDIFLVLILIIGLSLLSYPSVANWWNNRHSSFAIAGYTNSLVKLSEENYEEIFEEARQFNESLSNGKKNILNDYDEYLKQLKIDDTEMMGFIEIPKISVKLPVYHGVDEETLSVGIGHVEWSSLPTGDIGTHVVLSGHRGLPSARLFTDLDQMEEGDYFSVTILDRQFNYEVISIATIIPEDLQLLKIRNDEELCTLVTCTPYGVNSHRLLVTGRRTTKDVSTTTYIRNEAHLVDSKIVAVFVAAPLLALLFVHIVFKKKDK